MTFATFLLKKMPAFEQFSLEVVLVKQAQEHHWSSVIKGDDRGTYELVGEEAERVKEIHSRLEHLTSDKIVSDTMP